ncbi:asparagine synthase (glutamine-hydrolyzing) [Haliscomenobacter hydrossis]|uniref:asparagine synthase (glutamine-hydrolyzing) n=1 Tax=Haliscomenobacter hydrossis (strain ATCC 27775 / DSM 1100 / LMG 10767 / O) TaxID=760192 RepID=F4L458_HALH1|nr:asparagine synthase (glutamine-hydrolyzing) [Haliscomenobacter hydrossis]AEE50756.1 asparagine synthase (glutamine-hydrolyzing) [Haliscomenobacter hydrossis DSM 1100]
MCGITGIIQFGTSPSSMYAPLERMNQALAHRGPDDEGIWVEGPVALGHRRLSIIDLSSAGHQPMQSPDGRYVLVFNGEIYNFRTLKAELKDYPFRSGSDTEVILAAYAQWGIDCLKKLNGMYALALWDRQEQTLLLARDHLGIKPLYLYEAPQQILFASEVRSLLASGMVPRKINPAGISDYLRYQTVHAPQTMVQGVRMLEPGHYLLLSMDGRVEERAYWQPLGTTVPANKLDLASARQKVREALLTTIERQMIADVPFGAFLSGGIDSSSIVALMSQVSTTAVKTFSVTFAEEAFSEAPFARMIAEKYQTEHHEIRLSPDDFLHTIPRALQAMDHVSGDGPNTYIVAGATRKAGIKMALSGLGGDELFAGYPIFGRSKSLERLGWLNVLPVGLRQILAGVLAQSSSKVAIRKVAEVLGLPQIEPYGAYPLSRQSWPEMTIAQLAPGLEKTPNAVAAILEIIQALPGFDAAPLLSKISAAEMSTYMQNILLRDSDQMSMAHALEVRVPFLDHELVDLVMGISDAVKLPGAGPKPLLVAAMGEWLPDAIVNRPKMGFTLPYELWMKGALREFCAGHLAQLGERPFFAAAALQKLWQDFLRGHPGVKWSHLWSLVVLDEWLENNGLH